MNMAEKCGRLADKVFVEMANSGLTWDEAVAALGIAAKATSKNAAMSGDGTPEDCLAHAKKRFEEGLAQNVSVFFIGSDVSVLRQHYGEADAATITEDCRIGFSWRGWRGSGA